MLGNLICFTSFLLYTRLDKLVQGIFIYDAAQGKIEEDNNATTEILMTELLLMIFFVRSRLKF